MIEKFAELIPESALARSGRAFYSGRSAFSACSSLYILGLNPGGSPEKLAHSTVAQHTQQILSTGDADWSAYSDESWENSPLGTWGLQPRVLHLLKELNLNPRRVPSSNVVFTRSTTARTLDGKFSELAEAAWPFHQAVIANLGIRVVLCFGKMAGNWTAKKLEAHRKIDEFEESNKRRWRSVAFSNEKGLVVLVLTHPSRADWRNPDTDPTALAERVLNRH